MLVIVLVVVVVLALAAYVFCELSLSHRQAAKAVGRRIQAESYAESGIDFLLHAVTKATDFEAELYDNPMLFRGVAVVANEGQEYRGGFTIVAAPTSAEGDLEGIRFGIEDESNRLNLNLLKVIADTPEESAREMLMPLPGMTLEVADSILDWLDADDNARPYGAESKYYESLRPPYAAANLELTSISELLLVRGVTRSLLFGQDQNRNFLIEPSEVNASVATGPTPLSSDVSSRGWAAYLTLYSRDRDSSGEESDDQQGVNVNQDDMETLFEELLQEYGNREWAMFIVAFRQNGPYDGPSELDSATSRDLDLLQPGRFPITQALDLVGQNVQMALVGDSRPVVIASPFKDDVPSLEFSLEEIQEHLILSS